MNDRGIIASYLLSPLSKFTNLEKNIQFKLVRDSNSNTVNDLLINKPNPITLQNNLLIFRDTDEKLELQRDLIKMMNNKNYIFDLASLSDKRIV